MDLTQGVPISIQLKTTVKQEDTQDFLFDLTGQIIKIGDTLYIRYKEKQDGVEIPVTIKVEPDGTIQLIRSGEMRMRLRFRYQESMETTYRTPYGLFHITTKTHNLRFSLKDRPVSGRIVIDYDLLSQQQLMGNYHLELDFTA
ncbi:hypothetical protein RU97_GL001593 [Enterococcus canis]|uniref:DUF1934 domain-containing protein n=1 Tax=Enterococcus canis TaxID=214095 RepID=A0A1L8RGY9_9ENTE|nr:DUF1934 domain-containing protein [Enterococcus canis]OJG18975.1 hypothetical protein RU97_GL001593 [Enterococcus canis]